MIALPDKQVRRLVLPAIIAVVVTACDQGSGPTAEKAPAVQQVSGWKGHAGDDEASTMIRRIKDDLAEDRSARAEAAMAKLMTMRGPLSEGRQAEIDRLDAMMAGHRLDSGRTPE